MKGNGSALYVRVTDMEDSLDFSTLPSQLKRRYIAEAL